MKGNCRAQPLVSNVYPVLTAMPSTRYLLDCSSSKDCVNIGKNCILALQTSKMHTAGHAVGIFFSLAQLSHSSYFLSLPEKYLLSQHCTHYCNQFFTTQILFMHMFPIYSVPRGPAKRIVQLSYFRQNQQKHQKVI